MHIISDVQVAALAGIAVLHFVATALVMVKSFQNGRGIKRTRDDLTGNLDAIAKEIAAEMVVIRQAMSRIQAKLDGRQTGPNFGRRATDAPMLTIPDPKPTGS